jgi:dTDP-4-amino-4,6-dideoxygalactose transaminase
MRSEFLPFSRPTFTEEEISAVFDVLRAGWITIGPKSAEFEGRFTGYVGCGGAVALTSATAGTGLHFRAVHLQKYYTESMGTHRGTLPNTEWNSDRICSLPLFPGMNVEDVDDVVAAIKEILGP